MFKRGVFINPNTQFSLLPFLGVFFVCMQSLRLLGFMVWELWRTHTNTHTDTHTRTHLNMCSIFSRFFFQGLFQVFRQRYYYIILQTTRTCKALSHRERYNTIRLFTENLHPMSKPPEPPRLWIFIMPKTFPGTPQVQPTNFKSFRSAV